MNRPSISVVFISFILLQLNFSVAISQSTNQFDQSGRGAVLCIHWINAVRHEIARVCYPNRDKPIVDALRWSLDEHEKFIARNSELSLEQVKLRTFQLSKSAFNDETDSPICVNVAKNAMELYHPTHTNEERILLAKEIRKNTSHILEIDRNPLMNPCL
ncbi:MAG: hypothetical protein GY742_09670 [Hyphomicrobiales bacterium]|nr:hypothetical protein [Hyphomicrobiales bacterium]